MDEKEETTESSNPFAPKPSRADWRYQPLCKPLSEVMRLPKNKEEAAIFAKILDHYIIYG